MNITAAATTAGDALLVQVDEDTQTVRFLDDDDREIGAYTFETFAGARAALAIDFGRNIVIDGDTVAALQQFADLDAYGIRRRAA